MARHNKIDPGSFCQTLAANVDNDRLSDAEFREFVRNSLAVVGRPETTRVSAISADYDGAH